MERTKIDFGIDLGTTNSALALMENGKIVIKRSDIFKDIIPSCIGFKKKNIITGEGAWNQRRSEKLTSMRTWSDKTNSFIEFKRTMGTDEVYKSSVMDYNFNSEELSAEILKKLRSFIIDEDFNSAVITVPAKFDIPQMDATLRAARLAGFEQCELLSEPIAASMAYGLDSENKNGFWVVFDFGGGTFDAALVKTEEGIMKIVDTDGDNYLGGKNLDMAIVDEIIIPYLQDEYVIDSILDDQLKKHILRQAMKYYAEDAKIQLSFNHEHNILSDLGDIPGEDDNGEEFELDITITRNDLRKVIAPIFQRAINNTKELIERNNLSGEKLDSLILIGGPTYSPILREMIEEKIKKPDTGIDPMTAVAKGAALYASTIDVSEEIREKTRDKSKIQLDIGYSPSTVETEAWVTLKVLPEKMEGELPGKVVAEIIRGDGAWSSGKVEINEKGEIIDTLLTENKSNNFQVKLFDENGNLLEAQPDNFTIICGIDGSGAAILNHGIGIELDIGKPYAVFEPVIGLEKNVSIPATGTINGLKTKTDIRPGISSDRIRIGLYQADYDSKGSRAIYNKSIYDVIITGEHLPAFLPRDSSLDLTIRTDKSSGRIEKVEAYFPYLDHTHEVKIPEHPPSSISRERLAEELAHAESTIDRLKYNKLINQNGLADVEKELSYQKKRFEQGGGEIDSRMEVFGNLQKALRKADDLEDNIQWTALENELREEFERIENADRDLGTQKDHQYVNELRKQVDEVIRKQETETGKKLLDKMKNFYIQLTFIYQLMGFVRDTSKNFESFEWKDEHRAQRLINQAEDLIGNNPTVDELHPVVIQIIDLIIDNGNQEIPVEILRKKH